jgi:hypothetical protein
MIITTVKEIKETLRDGMYVYRRDTNPTRVIDARIRKGHTQVKVMYPGGDIKWVNHYPGDTYAQS